MRYKTNIRNFFRYNNKMKKLLFFIILPILISCKSQEKLFMPTTASIQTPTHLQPDTCLTDKQLKTYYKFVKDSIRIELRRDKQIRKRENDSLKIELKMLKSDNKTVR